MTDKRQSLRPLFRLSDLTSLSFSSVGPLFSMAVAGSAVLSLTGTLSWIPLAFIGLPLMASAIIFRILNQHFPNAGASYHWGRRVMGLPYAKVQAWVLLLAYFMSIPPIILPAEHYTTLLLEWNGRAGLLAVGACWSVIAVMVLWFGPSPTSRVTKLFLLVEMAAVLVLVGLGIWHYPAYAPKVGTRFHWNRIIIATLVASTMMDGWEIDSYAAEESHAPRRDPGTGGILGAVAAFAIYLILFPLLWHELPSSLLSGTNPLAAWGGQLQPDLGGAIAIAVLLSTAGSLWLTTYILSRIIYALARDRLLPPSWGRLNRHQVPGRAVIAIIGLAWTLTALALYSPGASHILQLALASAGFFLTAVFFLDNVTAVRFLWTVHHHQFPHAWDRHGHWGMMALAFVSASVFAAILVAYLWFGHAGDYVIGFLALVVIGWLVWSQNRQPALPLFDFDADAVRRNSSLPPKT